MAEVIYVVQTRAKHDTNWETLSYHKTENGAGMASNWHKDNQDKDELYYVRVRMVTLEN